MPDFSHVIRLAYEDILGREPDEGGLAHYNQLMDTGMDEAAMRESLLRSPEFAFRYPDPAWASRLGLNVHMPSQAILADVANELGIRWIRVDFDWFRIEPERGVFRWEEHDRVVDEALLLGLNVLATLAYTPAWASSAPNAPAVSDPPASVGFWTDVVGQAVARYRDRVREWQFWNEPNVREFWTGSMTQYRTEILEPAAAAARAIHPSVKVVCPGLANLRDWRDWFREILRVKDLIDVVNHHNYANDGREVLLDLERDLPGRPSLRTLMRELGVEGKPFWLTETGRRSDQGNQLEYYQDLVAALETKRWVSRVFFHHYWDGTGQGDGGFGIVNEDFSPKPAYLFLQSLVRPGRSRAAAAR